jgi:hypothetical protein
MTFFAGRRPALLRFAVAYRFFFLLFATDVLLFAGLPAAHDRIMGVGFFRRLRAELITILWFPGFRFRRLRGFITVEPYPLMTRPPPFGGLRRLRWGFITVEPYPLMTLPPPFGGLRFVAGACRLAFSAAFWRLVPKCLICFALILRRVFAMLLLFPLAGF